MNQIIENFGIDWHIFGAEIINFLVLLGILWYFLYKKIFSIIEERQEIIDSGLKKAEESETLLNDAREEKKDIIIKARKEAEEKIEKSLELGKKRKEDIIAKAKEKAKALQEKSKKDALMEKERIISDSQSEIAKIVVLGVEKVLSEK